MIKHIDLFMPPLGQYGVLHHFTKKFYEALMRCGINCRLLEAERRNPKPFLTQLFSDPPDCTLSFNGLLPDDEGRFFCDMIKIPHVACLVDSPMNFFPLIKSHYNIITCVDQDACDFFRGLKHQNTLFMPHAVEKNLTFDPSVERNYDVLFPTSYIDFEGIATGWDEKYPASLRKALYEAAEFSLANQTVPYVHALASSLEKYSKEDPHLDLASLDFISLLDELEMYLRGFDRVQLVKSIPSAKINIFGTGHTEEIWKRHLGKNYNVILHPAVSYDEVLELMRHSKIVLNSCAWIKNGAHERTLAALACGAVALTNETPYLAQSFTSGKDILFTHGNAMEGNDAAVANLLDNESKRHDIAAAGRNVVMHHHTWDQRAASLIRDLTPCIQEIKETATA